MKVDEFVETYARWWFAPETNIPGDAANKGRYDTIEALIHAYIRSVPSMETTWSEGRGWTWLSAWKECDDDENETNLNHKYVIPAKAKATDAVAIVYDKEHKLFRSMGGRAAGLHGTSLMDLLIKIAGENNK